MRPFFVFMERYGIIENKNPREIVLLRGNGCKWKKCTFCDYHIDSSDDENENFELNRHVLSKVSGKYKALEVINSGSFVDLDQKTVSEIKRIALLNGIKTLHFECHWIHRNSLDKFRQYFADEGIRVKYKIGVETFDRGLRENVLHKGMGDVKPEEIMAAGFEEVNLLFGIDSQNALSMQNDIETGLIFFERVCVNIMTENTSRIKPSQNVINDFMNEIYPLYKDDVRVDILLSNTDFGVG